MIWEDLNEDIIVFQSDASTSDEVFETLGKILIDKGYCKDSYVQALKDREKEYPTGINVGGFGIAIPHTDPEHVIRETESILTLKKPVRFTQMGSTDIPVDVKLVMMLTIKDPKAHIKKLQRIITLVQDQQLLKNIYDSDSADRVIQLIKEKEDAIEKESENLL
ncbi:PTS sugar transporter subunit IIA [Catenisphaera adipataccumulans]|jgi:PTS system galactitol-specific IIA component|uniref:PTS system galactitol-specific IIA component n=1 Tax=Catenisphaera adipataccumulans TaxID=700500 RepID=A0A7W8FW06_9FIRM|nr:PTS sugar transporter subunit IIA [Catenisphaera adipataccumulans]MBB5182771.1 PTS system galactitol-specific IIA component [Catenisphaera adipataccumulans]